MSMAIKAKAESFETPMLLGVYAAKTFNKYPEWYVSEKFDGFRMLYKNGAFYTRQGRIITVPETIADEAASLPADIVLDGELWLGYETFHEVAGAIAARDERLKFKVFDAPSLGKTFAERFASLNALFSKVCMKHIDLVQQKVFTDEESVQTMFKQVVARGGEGVVLKLPSQEYKFNTRSEQFMKMKPWDNMVVRITGFHVSPAMRKIPDLDPSYVSSLVCETLHCGGNDKSFKVSVHTRCNYAVGECIIIRYCHVNVNGLPKFPSIVGRLGAGADNGVKPKMPKEPKEPKEPKQHKKHKKSLSLPDPMQVMTIEQWTEIGGYAINNGEAVFVKNHKDVVYKVQRAKVGPSVYCSCPAWTYMRASPVQRTCKHCIAVCGMKSEMARIAQDK